VLFRSGAVERIAHPRSSRASRPLRMDGTYASHIPSRSATSIMSGTGPRRDDSRMGAWTSSGMVAGTCGPVRNASCTIAMMWVCTHRFRSPVRRRTRSPAPSWTFQLTTTRPLATSGEVPPQESAWGAGTTGARTTAAPTDRHQEADSFRWSSAPGPNQATLRPASSQGGDTSATSGTALLAHADIVMSPAARMSAATAAGTAFANEQALVPNRPCIT